MRERLRKLEAVNPLPLFSVLGGVALDAIKRGLNMVDEAMDIDWDPSDYRIPNLDYKVEAPVATEEELMDERAQRPDTL